LSLVGRFELLTLRDVQMALSKVTVALIAGIIISFVLAKFLPRTSIGRQVILQNSEAHDQGYVAQSAARNELLGMTGVTLTPLHPSGTGLINGKRYDVVTEGEYIDKNVTVIVTEVEGVRIVVQQNDATVNA
jgi:membrane-bound serine protease (ClpP class)